LLALLLCLEVGALELLDLGGLRLLLLLVQDLALLELVLHLLLLLLLMLNLREEWKE
jgi:hypothetical protein